MPTMTPTAILKKFFGFKEGQTLKEFSDELKTLSSEEKAELVKLAAQELGVEVEVK